MRIPHGFFNKSSKIKKRISKKFGNLSDKGRLSNPIFKTIAYPSKIYYPHIEQFVKRYSKKSATVLDTFAGSGSTGLAAAHTGRKAFLIDDSPYAVFIQENLFAHLNFYDIHNTYTRLVTELSSLFTDLYRIRFPDGAVGIIDNIISSNIYKCNKCGHNISLYGTSIGKRSEYRCPHCGNIINISKRSTKKNMVAHRKPVEVETHIMGKRCKVHVSNKIIKQVNSHIKEINNKFKDLWEPSTRIVYDRSYPRKGGWPGFPKHSKVGGLFSKKNLLAVKILNDYIDNKLITKNKTTKRFFKYVFTESLFRSSSRLFTTSGIKDIYNVPPVGKEQNVFQVFVRKYKAILRAFKYINKIITPKQKSNIISVQGNARNLKLPDNSFDYAFIDPPYGGIVPYAELNLFYSAWLKKKEDLKNEVIIPMDYEKKLVWAEKWGRMIYEAFSEVYRVLKPGAYLTIVFQSKFSDIWNILRSIMTKKIGFRFVEFIEDKRGTTFQTNRLTDTNPVSAYITYRKPLNSKDKQIKTSHIGSVFELLDNNDKKLHFRTLQSKIIKLSYQNMLSVPNDEEIKQWIKQ